MGDKVPIETYNMICKDLDNATGEIKRLKNKYEEPGQKCNSGHKNVLPVSLWDCPICTEQLRKEKEWLLRKSVDETQDCGKYSIAEEIEDEMQQALKEGE